MKIKDLYILVIMVLLFFASCIDGMQEMKTLQPQSLKQIVMTTQDFEVETDTRTLFEITEEVTECTWAADDTVGVFPDKGIQTCFPMVSGSGTNNAIFDGGGWALKDGNTYAAYYPCIGDFYLDKHAVPVNYAGQRQTGDASTEHLGAYDYMVATPTTTQFGYAQFMFKHLSALVRLKLIVSQPSTLSSVKLVAETKAFAVKGKVDIMEGAPSITLVASADELKLDLEDVTTVKENQEVTLYMMLPPVDLSKQKLKAVVATDKGIEEIALGSKNFQAGKAYQLSGELKGREGREVKVFKAGSLEQLLGSDYLDITSLKVLGPINGDDVRFLRKMLGAYEFSDLEKGKLISLDLSEVTIVKGGGCYWGSFYTSNNVIGDYMFKDCPLQNIVLPTNITSIGSSAFYNCFSLNSVTIGKDVTLIDDFAFMGCSSLETIDIPDGIVSINACVFSGCSSLTSIDIPSSVISIDYNAFYGCSSLTSVEIPDAVTSIGSSVFSSCSSLTSVVIGKGISVISNSLFENCSSLTSIEIPDGVTSIGGRAFFCCSSLASIEIPTSVVSIGNAFTGCSSLTTIDIPDGITSLADYVFASCSSLTSVNIPSSVISIGKQAFWGCSSLATIEIPENVVSIGKQAFSGCYSLGKCYCYPATPPLICTGSNSSFDTYGEKTILNVPLNCRSKYESSSWGSCFKNIVEMNENNEDVLPENLNAAIIGSWRWVLGYGVEYDETWSERRSGREIWTFNVDGTLVYIDRDGERNESKWSISNNRLIADGFDYTIETLNSERMVISEGEENRIEKRLFLRVTED